MELRFRRLDPRAVIPARAHSTDAGLDLCTLEPLELLPGKRAKVQTGIAIELPAGHAGLIVPRSGLAARHGLSIVNSPGLIDEAYRGELQILLLNTDSAATVNLAAGERVAQLVVIAVALAEPVEVEELGSSDRGEKGFGSSGRS
ncbi:MAG: dUTP diphosphatase [Actinobacteria bacterium]|uniref:dUTP diphosphatase n=1 Tax=freshwater metagenome TaxID=449393 RepID=A0A6J5ZUV6_9ZZZZ|nr:dUTP diphosphatase [Actinomycetota bacterium]